jgi:hypothetical protein
MFEVRPYVWYSKGAVDTMIATQSKQVEALQLRGYVLQSEPENGRFRFISINDSLVRGGRERLQRFSVAANDAWGDIDPIEKRTPEQRVESMMLKFAGECMALGRVPGLSDEQHRIILGAGWTGKRDITAEEVKAVCAYLLSDAENKREDSERGRELTPLLKV